MQPAEGSVSQLSLPVVAAAAVLMHTQALLPDWMNPEHFSSAWFFVTNLWRPRLSGRDRSHARDDDDDDDDDGQDNCFVD